MSNENCPNTVLNTRTRFQGRMSCGARIPRKRAHLVRSRLVGVYMAQLLL